jgi:hypothetical protein
MRSPTCKLTGRGSWSVSEETKTHDRDGRLLRFNLPNLPDLSGNEAEEQKRTGKNEG